MSQHKDHNKEVLHWPRKARLYMKAEKCEFYSNSIKYLGYILFIFRLSMFSDKNDSKLA